MFIKKPWRTKVTRTTRLNGGTKLMHILWTNRWILLLPPPASPSPLPPSGTNINQWYCWVFSSVLFGPIFYKQPITAMYTSSIESDRKNFDYKYETRTRKLYQRWFLEVIKIMVEQSLKKYQVMYVIMI